MKFWFPVLGSIRLILQEAFRKSPELHLIFVTSNQNSMTPNNPLLKHIKPGDIVLMGIIFGRQGLGDKRITQIVKITKADYEPANDEYKFDWLNFKGEVIYTSERVHADSTNFIFGNCLAIEQILPNEFIIEKCVKDYMLFKPTEHQLTDAERDWQEERAKQLLTVG